MTLFFLSGQLPFTVGGRWRRIGVCQCFAPTRQSMGPTSPGVWVRRTHVVGCEEGEGSWIPDSGFEGLFSAGEDMSADGRRQLALFLVSWGGTGEGKVLWRGLMQG